MLPSRPTCRRNQWTDDRIRAEQNYSYSCGGWQWSWLNVLHNSKAEEEWNIISTNQYFWYSTFSPHLASKFLSNHILQHVFIGFSSSAVILDGQTFQIFSCTHLASGPGFDWLSTSRLANSSHPSPASRPVLPSSLKKIWAANQICSRVSIMQTTQLAGVFPFVYLGMFCFASTLTFLIKYFNPLSKADNLITGINFEKPEWL